MSPLPHPIPSYVPAWPHLKTSCSTSFENSWINLLVLKKPSISKRTCVFKSNHPHSISSIGASINRQMIYQSATTNSHLSSMSAFHRFWSLAWLVWWTVTSFAKLIHYFLRLYWNSNLKLDFQKKDGWVHVIPSQAVFQKVVFLLSTTIITLLGKAQW